MTFSEKANLVAEKIINYINNNDTVKSKLAFFNREFGNTVESQIDDILNDISKFDNVNEKLFANNGELLLRLTTLLIKMKESETINRFSKDNVSEHYINFVEKFVDFLIEKNNAYGNSALEPVRIFSRSSAVEQINVRIDDKLSRIARGKEYAGDDTLKDLIGYLFLMMISHIEESAKEPINYGCCATNPPCVESKFFI